MTIHIGMTKDQAMTVHANLSSADIVLFGKITFGTPSI